MLESRDRLAMQLWPSVGEKRVGGGKPCCKTDAGRSRRAWGTDVDQELACSRLSCLLAMMEET